MVSFIYSNISQSCNALDQPCFFLDLFIAKLFTISIIRNILTINLGYLHLFNKASFHAGYFYVVA